MRALRQHIRRRWHDLSRDVSNAADLLTRGTQDGEAVVYVPRGQSITAARQKIARRVGPGGPRIARLPADPRQVSRHGLLYLPHRYVVPGGRFNEQFGWDSYFTTRGLLADGHVRLPIEMTENLLYEVRHYGGRVLNANRTFSLGRSQPPFLTRMILDVFQRTGDRRWLASTLDAVETYHRYWTSGAPLTSRTGLSRYVDELRGPAPEVEAAGTGEYERTRAMFRAMPEARSAPYYDRARDALTPRFFDGDRAMRASGFDTSNRFGPAGADTHEYNPVDLNALLYQMERDAARIAGIAGRRVEARRWNRLARERRDKVNRYLWDDARGLYFDHHVPSGQRSSYVYASTFFPLWAGMATREQAARVAANLHLFERAGGLTPGPERTGHQWDSPFGWAPIITIAVGGLRRYGYTNAAERLTVNFLSMVLKEFLARGELFEKYDVERRDADVSHALHFGYTTNEPGFAWTNAAFVDLYAQLSPAARARVRQLAGEGIPTSAPAQHPSAPPGDQ